ncbi:MAG: long-chain-fatty-acid--CoA ligase [Acidobacteria bacterium]|nr:long-chain-fatty-acid--CoA ligase [Acidobacteriota bacterium]
MNVPLTPIRFKERAAKLYGRKIGVICGEERFTYGEFAQRCNRLGNALTALGARAGDRVAFLSFNCHRLLEAYYGVLQAGAILLPLNLRLRPEELAAILHDAGASLLFYDSEFEKMVASHLRGCVSHAIPLVAASGETSYESLLAAAPDHYRFDMELDENRVAELFYTSGTTGNNKGVMLTHRNLYLHAYSVLVTLRSRDTHRMLHTIPLFHVNGWGAPHTITAVGGVHVMLRRFDPVVALEIIERERVTHFDLVPTMAIALLEAQQTACRDVRSVEEILIGGSAAIPVLIEKMEKVFGASAFSGYGLTETSPCVAISFLKDTLAASEPQRLERLSMAGLEVTGTEVRVVDSDGRDIQPDGQQIGEVIVRGDNIMHGYWNQPEATAETVRGGWLYTGDMAVLDSESYLQIVDRKKDIIVSGGENIPSLEIEAVLYRHPEVLECAVIPIPDEKWGEIPCALIVTRSGHPIAVSDLEQFCRTHLAGYKVPRAFHFRTSLPKGGTGKILKRELREPFWAGQRKRVH